MGTPVGFLSEQFVKKQSATAQPSLSNVGNRKTRATLQSGWLLVVSNSLHPPDDRNTAAMIETPTIGSEREIRLVNSTP
jgi:hypothetical protein